MASQLISATRTEAETPAESPTLNLNLQPAPPTFSNVNESQVQTEGDTLYGNGRERIDRALEGAAVDLSDVRSDAWTNARQLDVVGLSVNALQGLQSVVVDELQSARTDALNPQGEINWPNAYATQEIQYGNNQLQGEEIEMTPVEGVSRNFGWL
jgi:hypothetical protein